VRNALRPNDGGSSSSVTKTYPKFLHNPYNGTFTVAWGVDNLSSQMRNEYLLGMSDVVTLLNDFFDLWEDPALSYWILPYGASGNANNPGGDISFNFSSSYPDSKNQLTQALRDSGNFFWVGHGNPSYITPNPSAILPDNPKLTAGEIGLALDNPTTLLNGNSYVVTPYKLVILFACDAYSWNFANAFGIADFTRARTPASSDQTYNPYYLPKGRSMNTVQNYKDLGKIPQAYVGWPCNVNMPNDTDEVDYEQGNFWNMFYAWQDDTIEPQLTISQCVQALADWESAKLTGNLDPDGIEGVEKWELSGCYDLRITDKYP
jgi:hypothetical protein